MSNKPALDTDPQSPAQPDVVWVDGVPYAPTDEVLRAAARIAARDAELLQRLAQ